MQRPASGPAFMQHTGCAGFVHWVASLQGDAHSQIAFAGPPQTHVNPGPHAFGSEGSLHVITIPPPAPPPPADMPEDTEDAPPAELVELDVAPPLPVLADDVTPPAPVPAALDVWPPPPHAA